MSKETGFDPFADTFEFEDEEATVTDTQDEQDEVVEEEDQSETVDEEPAADEQEDSAEEDEEPVIEVRAGKENQKVPLGTFLDMVRKKNEDRDRAEKAERELADLRARYETPQADDDGIDPYVNPREYEARIYQQVETKLFNDRLMQGRQRALATRTEEQLNEIAAWAGEKAKSDPRFDQAAFTAFDPVEFAIQQYEQEQTFKLMTSDPEAFARKYAEEKGWFKQDAGQKAAPVQTPAKKKIQTLTGAGSVAATDKAKELGEKESFDAIFNSKR